MGPGEASDGRGRGGLVSGVLCTVYSVKEREGFAGGRVDEGWGTPQAISA
jgi:hypothetical protein